MDRPHVSVIIPAHNEASWLPQSLAVFRNRVGAPDLELIVVDNASTDETARIAQKLGATVVTEPRPGVALAREAGFRAARGEILATTDADTIVPADWLARIVAHFDVHPAVIGLGGPVEYDFTDQKIKRAVNRVIPVLHELDRRFHHGQPHFVGANLAVRRAAFEAVGGFRTDLKIGEDIDLAHRLQGHGRLDFLTDLVVTTSDRRFRAEGPQAILKYFHNYLDVTRPDDIVRKRLEGFLKGFAKRKWY